MKTYEYKVHYQKLRSSAVSREEQILETLNRLGSEGWRLVTLRQSLGAWFGGVNLLLEREIQS